MNLPRGRSSVIRLLLLLVAINACCAAVVLFSKESLVGGTFAVAVAWVLLSLLLPVARRGLVLSIVFVGALMVLFRLEIAALSLPLHRFPPPRPMFCEKFGEDEQQLLPSWHPSCEDADRYGNWAWVDKQDNVLLIVVTGEPRGARKNALQTGLFKCRVKVGADYEERFVTLPRMKDTLVVVLPDGSLHRFPNRGVLPIRKFQFWLYANNRGVEPSALELAGIGLEPAERAKFDRFLARCQGREPRGD